MEDGNTKRSDLAESSADGACLVSLHKSVVFTGAASLALATKVKIIQTA